MTRVMYHGPDRERPTLFKVIVSDGRIVQHHARLTEEEYMLLLDRPSLIRPGTKPAIAASVAMIAEMMS